MTRWAIAIAVLIGSAGCQSVDEDTASIAACNNICRCQTALPASHDACVEECIDEARGAPATCLVCAAEASCVEIMTGGCNEACFVGPQGPLGEGDLR